MKQFIIRILKLLGLYQTKRVPEAVSKNFIRLDATSLGKIKSLVIEIMLKGKELSMPEVQEDLNAHLTGRLTKFRNRHIPFLNEIAGLNGKKILEIGCGTGSSSVALAEQGALVTGLDVDKPSLKVAEERVTLYKQNDKITLQYGNATEVNKLYGAGQFDIVIFFASIEHMTHHERIAALKAAWQVTKPGGILCILGTPNRLWFFDMHTAFLPFYMWLPDDLAFEYSAFSPRDHFKEFYKRDYKEAEIDFLRWGRGVSYHELEVAIKPASQIKILGDLHSFERPRTFLQRWSYKRTDEYKFKEILRKNGPANISPAFYEYYLDVAIKRD